MVELSARAASNISARWNFPHVRQATFRHGGTFRTCGKSYFQHGGTFRTCGKSYFLHGGTFRTCGKQHFGMVELSARAASNISARWDFPHVRQATFQHGGTFRTCGKQHFGSVELSARVATLAGMFF
jgi:hypothetical protein